MPISFSDKDIIREILTELTPEIADDLEKVIYDKEIHASLDIESLLHFVYTDRIYKTGGDLHDHYKSISERQQSGCTNS